jgi:endonuclease YncB( thermonuclease family)
MSFGGADILWLSIIGDYRQLQRVATCKVDDTDLGEWLITGGFAMDWPAYFVWKIRHRASKELNRPAAASGKALSKDTSRPAIR